MKKTIIFIFIIVILINFLGNKEENHYLYKMTNKWDESPFNTVFRFQNVNQLSVQQKDFFVKFLNNSCNEYNNYEESNLIFTDKHIYYFKVNCRNQNEIMEYSYHDDKEYIVKWAKRFDVEIRQSRSGVYSYNQWEPIFY